MKFGISLPNFGRDAEKKNLVKLALSAEDFGFDSVWLSDHIIIPNSHKGFGPVFYEPLVTISYLSAITSKIRLGTSVLVLPYRNPIVLANMVSAIEDASDGRIIVGIGTGWLKSEFDTLGLDFKYRGEITEEYIQIMKNLWSGRRADPRSNDIKYSGIDFNQEPLHKSYPPLWIGGNSHSAIDRSLEFADGWHAVGLTPDKMKEMINTIKMKINNSNSGVKSDREFVISLRRNLQITEDETINSNGSETLRGTLEKIVTGLNQYEESGVDYLVIQLLSGSFHEIMIDLKRLHKEVLKEAL